MSLEKIQKDVDEWTRQFTPQYWAPLEIQARLTEEVGEVARELNHMHGPKKRKDGENAGSLGQEMVDVIFTICCLANSHKINLDKEWCELIKNKLYKRDNERFKKIWDFKLLFHLILQIPLIWYNLCLYLEI